jgi:phospholipase C
MLEDRTMPAPLSGALPVPVASLQYNNVNATPAVTNAFVNDLYLDVLYRAPSATELTATSSALNNSTLTGGAAFANVIASSSYQNVVRPIQTLYDALLGRSAEAGGLSGWVTMAYQGATLGQVALGIALSPEFQTVNGNVMSQSNDAFVAFLYQKLLLRTSSASERGGWVSALNSGSMTRGDVIVGFIGAPEFATAQPRVVLDDAVDSAYLGLWNQYPDANASSYVTGLANGSIANNTALGTQFISGAPYLGLGAIRNYVIGMYEGFLKRDPETTGYRPWRAQLVAQTMTDSDFFASIVNSPEYQQSRPTAQSTAVLAYQTLLGRGPSASELNAAVGLLNIGSARGLAQLLLSSSDYARNSYSQNVQHTVVIYQENWSFDGLYGNFPGANGFNNLNLATLGQISDATGQPIYQIPAPTNEGSANFPDQGAITGTPDNRFPPTNGHSALPVLPYSILNYINPGDRTGDIVHRFYHEQLQIDNSVLEPSNGQNDKFLTWSDNPGLVMSFLDATNLPEGKLAQQYVMDDNFFHSAYGGSFLNHQYLVAAAAPQWLQALPASNPNFASTFIPTTTVSNETDSNANTGGATTTTYTLAQRFVYPATVTGSVFIGTSTTAAYTFTMDGTGRVTLTPNGSPSPTITSASFNTSTDVLTLNWSANPGATSITVSYKYGKLNDGNLTSPLLTTQSPQGQTLNPNNNTYYDVNTTFGSQAPMPTGTVTNETDSNANAGGATTVTYTFAHVSVYPGTVTGSVFIGNSTTSAYTFTVNALGLVALTPNGTPSPTISSASFNATTGVLTLNWASNPGAASVTVSYHYGVISRDQLLQPINDTNPNGAGYEQNIGDELNTKGVNWKWYSGGWNNAVAGNAAPLFQFHHQAFAYFANYTPYNADGTLNTTNLSQAHLQDENNFFSDVAADNQALAGSTLPGVSFIKPLGPDNEHPGYTDVLTGQEHVAQLVDTLQNSIDWSSSNIVITYDENGGRWDQVDPPMIDQWGVGARVPGIEISPFARRGYVDHTQYETDSILTTIESQYGLNSMAVHDARANALYNAYDFGPSDLLKNNPAGVASLPVASPSITGVSAIATAPGTSSSQTTTSTGSSVSGSQFDPATTYTENFAGNSLALQTLTAGGATYTPLATGQLVLRRSGDATVPTDKVWYRGTQSGTTFNLEGRQSGDTQAVLNTNDLLRGTENLFGNIGSPGGTNSNIERLDVIFSGGLTATSDLAFAFFDRGLAGAHDPIRIAAITTLGSVTNAQGTFTNAPTNYGTIVTAASNQYGSAVLPAANYLTTLSNPGATGASHPAILATGQEIAGVLIPSTALGLTPGQTFFGFSLFADDITGSGTGLADWLGANFPTNSMGTTGANGLDLVATGATAYTR